MKNVAKKMKPIAKAKPTITALPPVPFIRSEFEYETIVGTAYGVRYLLPSGRTLVLREPTTEMMSTLEAFGFDFTAATDEARSALTQRMTTQLSLFLSIILVWEQDGEFTKCQRREFENLPVMLEAGLLGTATNDFFSLSMRRTTGTDLSAGGPALVANGRA